MPIEEGSVRLVRLVRQYSKPAVVKEDKEALTKSDRSKKAIENKSFDNLGYENEDFSKNDLESGKLTRKLQIPFNLCVYV